MGFSLVEGVEGEEGADSSGHDCEFFFFFLFSFSFFWSLFFGGVWLGWIAIGIALDVLGCFIVKMGMWDADCDAE